MVFATPPAIAGVILRVFCILTKLLDETVRRIRGSVVRYRPFPTQKLGRCFGQPD